VVIRYGFVGGQNLFKEFKEQLGKIGEKAWQARRRAIACGLLPKQLPESYALDKWRREGRGFKGRHDPANQRGGSGDFAREADCGENSRRMDTWL